MRVFDCFTFFNEFEILELRLEELYDVVDYFVICEASTTHNNNPKPFYLKDNFSRFEKYADKIKLLSITDMPRDKNTWVDEKFQRKALERGLTDLRADDLVIVSDADEIPRAEAIQAVKEDTNDYDRYLLSIPMFYFKLNFYMYAPQYRQRNIAISRGRVFSNPQLEREFYFTKSGLPSNYACEEFCILEHAGWHFTYFAHDNELAVNKLKNFAHANDANTGDVIQKINVDYMIQHKVGFSGFDSPEKFEYITVDDYFPSAVLANPEKYDHLIVKGDTKSIYEFYPEC